jgi:hypothetical protein
MVVSSQMIAMFLGLCFFFRAEYVKKRTYYPKFFWILPCVSTAPKFGRSPKIFLWGEGTKIPRVHMSYAILPHVIWFRPTFSTFFPNDIWFLHDYNRCLGGLCHSLGASKTNLGAFHLHLGATRNNLGATKTFLGGTCRDRSLKSPINPYVV